MNLAKLFEGYPKYIAPLTIQAAERASGGVDPQIVAAAIQKSVKNRSIAYLNPFVALNALHGIVDPITLGQVAKWVDEQLIFHWHMTDSELIHNGYNDDAISDMRDYVESRLKPQVANT